MTNSTLLVGTAVTRPGAVGTLYRCVEDGPWETARGIPLNTGVQAIASHPRLPGVAFAATRGGMYKSTNSGESWEKLALPSQNEAFWCVTVHPARPDQIYAGTAPIGVYRSDDCGTRWRRVGSKERMPELCDMTNSTIPDSRLMRISFDPTNPDLAFGACETNGVIISEDGGETWCDDSLALIELSENNEKLRSKIITQSTFEGILDGHAVCLSSRKPGVLFYACRMGVFSTADKGQTWRNHDVGRFAPFSYSRDLRIAVDDPATFYLALSIASRSASGAFYRSCDLGETWKRVDEAVTAKSTIMSTNLHATDPKKLIYLTRGGQVMWTEDRCASWNERQLPADAGDGFCAGIL
jgi:photosystem II stability/assembly factor-like uncharacterized protein